MEDQGKRLLLAVALAFILMLGWNFLFPPEKKAPEEPSKDATAEKAEKEKAGGDKDRPSGGPAEVAPAERAAEQLVVFQFDRFRAVFSTYGGVLQSWELLGERYIDKLTGTPINLVPLGKDEAGAAFAMALPDSTLQIPTGATWTVGQRTDTSVTFRYESPSFVVSKRYELMPEEYRLVLSVLLENKSTAEAKETLSLTMVGYQDPTHDTGGGWGRVPREWKAGCYGADGVVELTYQELQEDGDKIMDAAHWAGPTYPYFLAAMAPDTENSGGAVRCELRGMKNKPGGLISQLDYPTLSIAPGGNATRELTAYLGPKYLDELEAISAKVPYHPGFEEAVVLGWLAFIARPLIWLLQWFHSFVGNWGIAIILLTFTVKLATLYWTHKSMRSMQEMAKLRPQLEKIREKFEDDKQRQQVETMNLFKAHKVNPLAGCLPMLLQMPIWFALYRGLSVAAELYQAPFIPGWINDLTSPDPYYIMPVVLTGLMFLQSRMTPQTGTGAQQKMLQYGMPLMFGVFSFFFPAGLTLYILTNTCLTLLHHLYMHRGRRAAAAAGTGASAVIETTATETRAEKKDGGAGGSGGTAGGGAGGGGRPSGRRKRGGKGKRKGS